jgi:type II secretory pathway component PulM
MKDWFEELEPRERLFVSVGAIVVVIAVFWGLVWMPLDKGHRGAQERVAVWEQSLAELRPLASQPQPAAGAQGRPRPASTQSPVVIVDTTLRNRSLGQPKRSQPTPGDLSNQYGMNVQAGSLSVAAQSGPGRINATLTIERTL